MLALGLVGACVTPVGAMSQPPETAVEPFVETIKGTGVTFEMAPIPVADNGEQIWMSVTEVPWEVYDVFVYNLDESDDNAEADAVSRPSKPYVPPDRGFGHAGYPAMGMTMEAAGQFCEWLSLKTGRRYRLPTEAEWERACLAGSEGAYSFGDDETALSAHAWHVENADYTTHPVGKKPANAWGLYDMHGNVAEWTLDEQGKGVACGGSYLDEAPECKATARQRQKPSWNSSDPQLPKSRWWLADCGFVGMRLVCEEPEDR